MKLLKIMRIFSDQKGISRCTNNPSNLYSNFDVTKIKFLINSKRLKRSTIPKNNLFLEYLVVIDSSVYKNLNIAYGSNLPESIMSEYIKIFFVQIINGVIILFSYSLLIFSVSNIKFSRLIKDFKIHLKTIQT
jgi:hypothetical protein